MLRKLLQKLIPNSPQPRTQGESPKDTMASPPHDIELRHTLRGHTRSVFRIAWSPDGRKLASPSEDGTVRLWDTASGTLLRTLEGHAGWAICVAWSPDGSTLISGSGDQTIRLWDVATGQPFRTLRGHTDQVRSVAWSPDGRMIASVSGDNMIRLHDAMTGALTQSLSAWGTPVAESGPAPKQYVYRVTRMAPPSRPAFHVPPVGGLAWLPNGQIAWGTADGKIQFWDPVTGALQRTFEGATNLPIGMAWSPDGRTLATISTDRLILIWDVAAGRPLRVLEGHTNTVTFVSFSYDGRLLASKSMDNTVRIWRCDTWETVKILDELIPYTSLSALGGVAFHPSAPALATLGESETAIQIWDLNVEALLNGPAPIASVHYSNAKVVLVGDSGVGKSGLALVLSGQPFAPTISTHGRYVRLFDRREVRLADGSIETRETLLWDLAGQPGDRLIHQLHLNEVALALIVFDSRSEADPFTGVHYWDRALRLAQRLNDQAAPPLKKFLVAARTDRGVSVSRAQAQALADELGFDGYLETSAKEGWGIAELRTAIFEAIAWESFPKVTSTQLFQSIKSFLVASKETKRQLATLDALYHDFLKSRATPTAIDNLRAEFETCTSLIETRGLIRRLNFGDLVLLQPELLDAYASSLINAAKEDPDGLGSISEEDAQRGNFRMPEDERIFDREQERLLLLATIEDLLRHQIVQREPSDAGMRLVFPSQLTREHPALTEPFERTVAFLFEGPVLTIYATLAVRLSHSGAFKKREMWKNAVSYTAQVGGVCGMHVQEVEGGRGELSLFFDPTTSEEIRFLFEEYIHTHLQRRALPNSIQRRRTFACPKCAMPVPDLAVTRRLERGLDWIKCSVCDEPISLRDREARFKDPPAVLVTRMDIAADAGRALETAVCILRGKVAAGDRDHPEWDIIVTKLRRLHVLELQQAQYGIATPAHITLEIEDLRRELGGMEKRLQHSNWVQPIAHV